MRISESSTSKLEDSGSCLQRVGDVKGRRNHIPAFTASVALKAVKGDETVAQLVARYEVRLGQVQAWQKALT